MAGEVQRTGSSAGVAGGNTARVDYPDRARKIVEAIAKEVTGKTISEKKFLGMDFSEKESNIGLVRIDLSSIKERPESVYGFKKTYDVAVRFAVGDDGLHASFVTSMVDLCNSFETDSIRINFLDTTTAQSTGNQTGRITINFR